MTERTQLEPLPDADTVRRLVKRVMDDGKIDKMRACVFVAGMFRNAVGWDVYRLLEGDKKT